jgi:uncharacterized membrane protein YphA (DoxX/SURF4 family)
MTALLQGVLAVFFLFTALAKLLRHPHMRKEFQRFGYPYSIAMLAGALELIGSSLLIVGFWLPPLAALGSAVLLTVMLGATYTNFSKRPAAYGFGMLGIVALTCIPLWVHGPASIDYVTGAAHTSEATHDRME